ncbi:sugar ABC transporter permease [Halospeciosus flavus]|uniref:Sugar ABC transporter permease n=1 Tax=Halospeciosus flavus TaxID=3032283 RepID=A0ABD5Z1B2_9EURY|nr:ABC transporter permease subunit [Halospeciosus flavus]
MSLLRSIRRSVTEDVVRIAKTPGQTARNIHYTARGVYHGEIPARRLARTLLSTTGAVVLVMALLFPIYWILLSAFSGTGGSIYASGGFHLLPQEPSLKPILWVIGNLGIPGYVVSVSIPLTDLVVVFNTPEVQLLDVSQYGVENPSDFKKYLWNSLTVAIPTVILAMCLIVPGAYALSRREFIFRRKLLFGYVLFTQVGGGLGIAALIALYAMFVQVGLNNNKLALAAYYAATAVPFNTWLLKTYMDGIPVSYEEAAVVDGAPPWKVVTEVILPLSTAGLATVFIFTFLTGWTEFVVAQTLLSTDNYTLPVGLYALVNEYSIPWARFAAFALIFASPIVVIYLFAQRYIEGGLSFGGMEG